LNASQKRLFEEARKRNPDLKMPSETTKPPANWSEADLQLVKQGVGDKTSRPATPAAAMGDATGEAPSGEQSGSVVTYFEAKGFGFLRPDDGGRDIFFHVSRLSEGLATDLRPGTRVLYELGMDRTGKMAASSLRIPPPAAPAAAE
jgi:CspA family cold shock protein